MPEDYRSHCDPDVDRRIRMSLSTDPPPSDESGQPPDPRFTLANERTLLAWNRTGLALIVAGLAAAQLLDVGARGLVAVLSFSLVALGVVLSALSYRRWEQAERAMWLGRPLPDGHPHRILVGGIALIGLLAAVVVVVDATGSG